MIEMNAQIEKISIGLDRGFALCGWVHVKRQDGFHQGFGGFVLGGLPDSGAGRHGAQKNLAGEWLVSVMRAADVEDYSKAVGKVIRIRLDGEGFGSTITAIGHPLDEDKWFEPKSKFAEMTKD